MTGAPLLYLFRGLLIRSELEPLDLAGGGLGQFFYEVEPPGVFVAGQAVLAVFQQIVGQ